MRGSLRGAVYASIQLGEAGSSALDQHVAQGVVLAPDLVLVPDPPELEAERWRGAHVLLARTGRGEGRRVAIRGLELLSLEGRGICGAALMAEPVPDPGRHDQPSDPGPLVEAIRAEGSIWSVLLGLVPDGSGPGSDPARFLDGLPGGLPDVPVVRGPRRTDFLSVGDIGKSICWFVPWCQPDGPF